MKPAAAVLAVFRNLRRVGVGSGMIFCFSLGGKDRKKTTLPDIFEPTRNLRLEGTGVVVAGVAVVAKGQGLKPLQQRQLRDDGMGLKLVFV
jgi:hypothetical protein